MPVNILYIVSRLRSSGPTNQLYYLLQHLDDGFDPTILTLSPEPDDTELPRFEELDITYETLGLSRWKGLVYGSKRLRKIVAKHDPDIVQTQGIRADTLSALFLSDYPRITTIRNYPYHDYPAKFGSIRGKLMALVHLSMYRRIDNPVACSETIANMVEPHGIDAIPIQNGVDTEKFSPVSSERKIQFREKLDIPDSATVFISVGSLIPRKNPLDLIEGFQEASIEGGILLMLGDGPLQEECEKLTAGDESVRIEGWIDNVVEYLGASDYFISASGSEGLPNTVMESLAVGLPVCLSDIPPHKEILQIDPTAGVYFELNNPTSLSKSLEQLISHDYSNQSLFARKIIKDNLSAIHMSEKYQKVYKNRIHK